jgi:hypothetical protein
MKLSEAVAGFLASVKEGRQGIAINDDFEKLAAPVLNLLESRFAGFSIEEFTPAALRDFLARWYVEEASAQLLESPTAALAALDHFKLPTPAATIESLAAFFDWLGNPSHQVMVDEHLKVLAELRDTLPAAIAINLALTNHVAERRGAFSFPEFLTSFEDGGQSQYDIGAGGESGAREGYFRILRIEGVKVEAEEVITETQVYPIIFPQAAAEQLQPGYLINLEIVRENEVWQIINCGFAYPPNTDI